MLTGGVGGGSGTGTADALILCWCWWWGYSGPSALVTADLSSTRLRLWWDELLLGAYFSNLFSCAWRGLDLILGEYLLTDVVDGWPTNGGGCGVNPVVGFLSMWTWSNNCCCGCGCCCGWYGKCDGCLIIEGCA